MLTDNPVQSLIDWTQSISKVLLVLCLDGATRLNLDCVLLHSKQDKSRALCPTSEPPAGHFHNTLCCHCQHPTAGSFMVSHVDSCPETFIQRQWPGDWVNITDALYQFLYSISRIYPPIIRNA